jgi:hypothetical protein
MKNLSSIILLLISFNGFGQNNQIKNIVSQIFFGYDVSVKPQKIESKSFHPFDYGDNYNARNIVTFNSHALVKSNFRGNYNITYFFRKDLFEDYGLYNLSMEMYFDDYKSCMETMEKLKRLCRNNVIHKTEIIGREKPFKSVSCNYLYDEKLQIPRITLDYKYGPHRIEIEVYTTYDFSKFKKYKNKLW